MSRCKKVDGRGAGCVGEAGHRGRHRVRPDPDAVYGGAKDPGKPSRRRRGRPTGKPRRQGADLVDLARRIEEEAAGLVADAEGVVGAVDAALDALKARQEALLKALIRSRRQVGRLKGRVSAERHLRREAQAALDAPEEKDEDPDGDPDGEDEKDE